MVKLLGGRYQFKDDAAYLLGRGGMGTVYRGLDTETEQPVAIKQLNAEVVRDDEGMLERFTREAETLRRLNHPNIVAVLATLEDEGQHYIIMEYMAGGSLRDMLDETPILPVRRVLEISIDLADALTRAHRLKIYHRDIKPANVMFADDNLPRLTDFGVAQVDDAPGITRSGMVVGTVHYVSPEALEGQATDGRTDIWSLGVMMYEMLAGRRPFISESMTALLTTILTKQPPDLRDLRPDVPERLALLIDMMLVKDPADRIESIRQVGAELERIILELASQASQPDLKALAAARQAAGSAFDTSQPIDIVTPHPSQAETAYLPQSDEPSPSAIPEAVMDAKTRSVARPRRLIWAGMILLVVIILGGLSVWATSNNSLAAPATTLPTIAPFTPSDYGVLIAPLQAVSTEPRNVARFIANDLTQHFTEDVPFSNIAVRVYHRPVVSAEEAQQAAEETGAAVVVWGNYNANRIQLNIQVGALQRLPDMVFTRDTLAHTANIRVELPDEFHSVAEPVAGVLAIMLVADGDVYEWARIMSVMDSLEVETPPLTGMTTATEAHRFLSDYLNDDADATRTIIDEAISEDVGNALLYALRSLHFRRQYIMIFTSAQGSILGNRERLANARSDMETAARLAPEGWVLPLYTDYAGVTNASSFNDISLVNTSAQIEQALALRPDLWALWFIRSQIAADEGDFDTAWQYINEAIRRNHDISLHYTSATLLALRMGNLIKAAELINMVVEDLPDPALTTRLFDVLLGIPTADVGLPVIYSQLIIGQYDAASSQALAYYNRRYASQGLFDSSNSMLLLNGIAQCSLENYSGASLAFQSIVSTDRDFMVGRLLRGIVFWEQGERDRAQREFDRIADSEQAEALAPYVAAVQAGELTCRTIFDVPTLQAAQAAYRANNS